MKIATKIVVSAALLLASAPAFAHGMGGGMGGGMNAKGGPNMPSMQGPNSSHQTTTTQKHSTSANTGHVGFVQKLVLQGEERELTRRVRELRAEGQAVELKYGSGPQYNAVLQKLESTSNRLITIQSQLAQAGGNR
jgi:hypothetical protein